MIELADNTSVCVLKTLDRVRERHTLVVEPQILKIQILKAIKKNLKL